MKKEHLRFPHHMVLLKLPENSILSVKSSLFPHHMVLLKPRDMANKWGKILSVSTPHGTSQTGKFLDMLDLVFEFPHHMVLLKRSDECV